MKYRYQIRESNNAAVCAKAIEILHTEGIESAQAWLEKIRKNDLYNYIERQYLKSRKIIHIN